MLAFTACGTGCGRLGGEPLLCEWFSTLELRLALRLRSRCWIWGKALELWAQQFWQAGLADVDMDCWINSFTRWQASLSRFVLGSKAETRWRHALYPSLKLSVEPEKNQVELIFFIITLPFRKICSNEYVAYRFRNETHFWLELKEDLWGIVRSSREYLLSRVSSNERCLCQQEAG